MVSGNGQNRRIIPAVLIAVAVAVCLFAAPKHYTDHGRVLMRDALQPGLRAWNHAINSSHAAIRNWGTTPDINPPHSSEPDDHLRLQRQLQAENAAMHEQLQQAAHTGTAPYRGTPSSPLLVADLLEARVLGEESVGLLRGGLLLNHGLDASLTESDFVLQDESPLVDAGRADRVEPGFPVFAGRTVIGRIHHVGRWSSSIEPVTAHTFRASAQLIRKTPNGYVFGATGVIKGTGKSFCRLEMVAATEPVAVGDGVYTVSDGGAFPYPMYYGQVSRASLPSGAPHWEIDVEPVGGPTRPRTVLVLRRRLNPERERMESHDRNAPALPQSAGAVGRSVRN